jgi:four helix bundle protein
MDKIVDFRELVVWQTAHELALAIYRITKKYPAEKRFGLTNQTRRAAVSIPANIAEGFARSGQKDKAKFYNIALGSLQEIKYYLILSKDLAYIESDTEYQVKADVIGKMLNKLIAKVLA